MKKIRIGFCDFSDGFDPEKNFITEILGRHFEVEVSQEPDYLFFSVFGNRHLAYDCIKVFYTGENQSPDFNICDYAIGFDPIVFGDRYLRLPLWCLYYENAEAMQRKHLIPEDKLLGREGFCSFVYSNNNSSPERNRFFELLSQYRPVASGGRFRNNVGGPVDDKIEFQKQYRFCIAFENASQPGYATEKLEQAFASGAIPIYWGDPLIGETFNEASFVNCHDYSSFEEVVEVVKDLDSHPEKMAAMLKVPALLPGAMTREEALKECEAFLISIVNQPLETASRYSRQYWGRRYLKLARSREKAYQRSFRGVAERIYKKTLWKARYRSKFLWKIDRLLKK